MTKPSLDRPTLDNAPGLTWRPLKRHRWMARWQCRRDIANKGFKPKTHWLWQGTEPTKLEIAFMQEQCQRLQNEMLIFARGGIPVVAAFDGTVRGLIASYQNDPDSPYHKLRYGSRTQYDCMLNRIEREIGNEMLSNMKARFFLRLYDQWSANGAKPTNGHHHITMLRLIINFGATYLEDDQCERLSGVLHSMKFKMGKPREERLTVEQVNAIRDKAHEVGRPSIALAQAFQFDCILRQKDVIGEWVPISEAPLSDVVAGNMKWLRGIQWQEIDANMILSHVTSKRDKKLNVPLSKAPMVMQEFDRLFPHFKTQGRAALPASGPVIVSEYSRIPWGDEEYRRQWRKLATAAGVPKTVRNMDSRAGGITEATEAGAQLEHVRHAATHGDIGMTQRYSRGADDKIAIVMDLRSAHRNKGGKSE